MTLADVQTEVLAKTPASRRIHESSHRVLCVASTGTLAVPYPIYVRESKGSRVTDIDGNEYIDLTMGFGPHILGHAPDVVVDAVRQAVGRGTQWALHNPYQEPLARLLIEASPCAERVIFCNTGTEATMHAIRAVRAFTGRTKIALFEGCYHGAHDYALVSVDTKSPRDAPSFLPWGDGVPEQTLSTVAMLPYWSDDALDLIRRQRHELAAVMVEPVQSRNPGVDHVEWLRKLSEVCRETGVLLFFDEVYTGFRLAFGGAQELFGITPDIATYGKILGGGMPIGAVAGRADIMDVFYRRGDEMLTSEGPRRREVFSAGTFSGNPVSVSAGYAAVNYLREHPDVYKYLHEQSHRLAGSINDYCVAEDIPAQVLIAESIMVLYVQPRGPIRNTRDIASLQPGAVGQPMRDAADALYLHMLNASVVIPGVHGYVLSTAHTPADVDTVIDVMKRSLLAVRNDGLFEPVWNAAGAAR